MFKGYNTNQKYFFKNIFHVQTQNLTQEKMEIH